MINKESQVAPIFTACTLLVLIGWFSFCVEPVSAPKPKKPINVELPKKPSVMELYQEYVKLTGLDKQNLSKYLTNTAGRSALKVSESRAIENPGNLEAMKEWIANVKKRDAVEREYSKIALMVIHRQRDIREELEKRGAPSPR